jgi:hypothetical protein
MASPNKKKTRHCKAQPILLLLSSNYSMEKKKWPLYVSCIGVVCLFIAIVFGKHFSFPLRTTLSIFGAVTAVSSLFLLGLNINFDEQKKIPGRNGHHPQSLFRKRGIGEGIGWSINFENPYGVPFLIFIAGIIPALLLSMLNDSCYPLLAFSVLVILPLIIRKFRKR